MSQPKSLRALLAHWHPAGERVALGGEVGALAAAWPDAVGEDVARRTRTTAFRDGTLTVITPSNAWSHQLTFLAPTIVQRMCERCPGVDLRKLRFVVATGRSRALLARGAQPRRARRYQTKTPIATLAQDAGHAACAVSNDPAVWLDNLRHEQTRLDRERLAQGWRRCRTCGRWSPKDVCEPCAQEARRHEEGLIAQRIAAAPWLRFEEHARSAPGLDARAYARVRRALLTQWEQQLRTAQRRLRRDALDAADRVVAWSYVMLTLHARQTDVSPAVLANTLGQKWADALNGRVTTRARERERKARQPVREK